jgi:hypothetical protein
MILSATTTPPFCIGAEKFTLKSRRLSSPVAVNPARVPPNGSGPKPFSSSQRHAAGHALERELAVRTKPSRPRGSGGGVGHRREGLDLEESADLMWSSRWGLPVSIEVRSISAVTDEASGSSGDELTGEVLNLPRTLLTILCRTEKPPSEWTGSMDHAPAT